MILQFLSLVLTFTYNEDCIVEMKHGINYNLKDAVAVAKGKQACTYTFKHLYYSRSQ